MHEQILQDKFRVQALRIVMNGFMSGYHLHLIKDICRDICVSPVAYDVTLYLISPIPWIIVNEKSETMKYLSYVKTSKNFM